MSYLCKKNIKVLARERYSVLKYNILLYKMKRILAFDDKLILLAKMRRQYEKQQRRSPFFRMGWYISSRRTLRIGQVFIKCKGICSESLPIRRKVA